MKNVYYLKVSYHIPPYLFEEIVAQAKLSDVIIREAWFDGKQRLVAHTTTPLALHDFLKGLPLPPLCLPSSLLCVIPDEDIYNTELFTPEKMRRGNHISGDTRPRIKPGPAQAPSPEITTERSLPGLEGV